MTAPGQTTLAAPLRLVPTEREWRDVRRGYGAHVRELAEAAGVPCYPPSEDERYAAWIAEHGSPELQAIDAACTGQLRALAGRLRARKSPAA